MKAEIIDICKKAKDAAVILAYSPTETKNRFLKVLADLLLTNKNKILTENRRDVEKAVTDGMDSARIDRLSLTDNIINSMAEACLQVAAFPDPVGALDTQWQRPNGILVGKMRVPLGVIAMIYEARPNVTTDAAILCLKAGNATILRGGSEAFQSNLILATLLAEAARLTGLPETAVQLVPTTDREAINILCAQDKYIDVIIPRGGEKLIKTVTELATMPVLKHYKGVCHIYVDNSADLNKACLIIENSKTQRPGVCNALECLLVNKEIATEFLPKLAQCLAPHHVIFHADETAFTILGHNSCRLQEEDKGCEFHSLDLSVLVVNGMDEAIKYIGKYGSNHTDVICTENYSRAMRFLREVDASMVGVNVSTRFNDGGELGLGAEIGISTSKLHAYGPMGIRELTTSKFVVLGNGQIRQ